MTSGDTVEREAPLGRHEIAHLLDVLPQTVTVWQSRGIFPEPDMETRRQKLWWRETIERWARDTGRWPYDEEGTSTSE